ncbi:hypothetical protein R1flu_023021 [Riccia fluitans]|uniref:rRNA adenine N(6)-methyltransferase n=1 Tax=Riccia fluitans TaxID=41844 RepID=A0ABD1XQV7_9MARC
MQLSGFGCCSNASFQFGDFSCPRSLKKNFSDRINRSSAPSTSDYYVLGFSGSFGCEGLRKTHRPSSCRRYYSKSAAVRCSVSETARSRDDIESVVRALQSRERFPKKWMGQHYMVNEKVNGKVVDAARISPGDLVVEIGPGTGALTKTLVAAGAHVIAVEKDPDMASLVAERFEGSGKVDVVNVDFLKWPLRNEVTKYLEKASLASGEQKLAKVVSNLPFNITTDVVKRVLPMGDLFSTMVLLLQDEAAIRLVDASPDSGEYRPISFVVQFYSVPEYKFKVPRKSFFPVPRVDGGVVRFDLKKESEYPPVASTKNFFSMINSAFNGKRKMLRNTLQHMFTPSKTQAALLSVGLPETARPEELTLVQFVEFYNEVTKLSQKGRERGDKALFQVA